MPKEGTRKTGRYLCTKTVFFKLIKKSIYVVRWCEERGPKPGPVRGGRGAVRRNAALRPVRAALPVL